MSKIELSNIKNNDVLVLFSNKKIVIDYDKLSTSEISMLLKKTKRIERNRKTIAKKNMFRNNKIKNGDIFVLFDGRRIIFNSKIIKHKELNFLLNDTRKIIRDGITLAKRKDYKSNLIFNQRYNQTLNN